MKVILLIAMLAMICFSFETDYQTAPISNLKKENEHAYKNNALEVLVAKCNICHRIRNPRKVFNLDNMDGFAAKINDQVFIKQRMPKGKKVVLEESEKEILKNWINNLK